MRSSIVPLRSVSPELALVYLRQQGLTPEVATWKYFDEAFNRGAERGYVWLSKERVKGFIGIIPAKLATPTGDRDMVWTCDWSVEEWDTNPGIGIKLLKKVQSTYGFVGGVGGSDYTLALVPRMETRTVKGAAVTLRLPLRFGPLLEAAERRIPYLPKLSRTGLKSIRLPRRGRAPNLQNATFRKGASRALAPLFDRPATGVCHVRHEQTYLDWIARHPGTKAFSCLVGDDGAPAAGAFLWSRPDQPGSWRAVFRSAPEADDALRSAIVQVSGKLSADGASLLSTMVSHTDAAALALLGNHGFVEVGQRWPLLIPERDEPGSCQEGFTQMSYLDTDFAFLP